MEVDGAPVFLGEPEQNGWETPAKLGGPSARVEVSCDDPDAFIARAVEAGAKGSLDRTREDLCHTDAAIVSARKRLLDAPGPWARVGKAPAADDSYYHLRPIERVLPSSARWLETLKAEMYHPARAPI